jgi:hypothetical protein
MPKLSCRSCGRQIYTVAPLEALFAEERRCPRCGAFLHEDRRMVQRRVGFRRTNPRNDPGPPKPKAKPKPKTAVKAGATAGADGKPKAKPPAAEAPATDDGERRVADRRTKQRRASATGKPTVKAKDPIGWRD